MKLKLLLLFILTVKCFAQSINWERIYHDDYGRPLYTGGTSYTAPAFADIDGDGDYDYFQGCKEGTIWFFENIGTPDSAAWHFVTERYNDIRFEYLDDSNVTFTDIDADGDLDMFIGGHSPYNNITYGIHFYRNDGDRNTPHWTFVTDKYQDINVLVDNRLVDLFYYHLQFADIDNDNDLDLFFVNYAGRVIQYENTGNDSSAVFTMVTKDLFDQSQGTGRLLLSLKDIDNDGDIDLFSGSVFYRNIGTPDSAIWQYEDNHYYDVYFGRGLCLSDIDNDADFDMFVGLWYDGVYKYENTGTSQAARWSLSNLNPFTIDLGIESNPSVIDIDNDGLMELFITHGDPMDLNDESIWFYENEGSPLKPRWELVTTQFDSIWHSDMSGLSFIDLDNDNDSDILLGDFNSEDTESRIILHENTGDSNNPQFSKSSQIILSLFNHIKIYPAFVDIDSDGDYDMFVSDGDYITNTGENPAGLHFYRNEGNADQAVWTHIFSESYPMGIVTFMDEDSDGDYDMFIGGDGFQRDLIFYENTGDKYNFDFRFITYHYDSIEIGPGTDFLPHPDIYYSPAFADIDADGDKDLIIGELNGGINVFINTGPTSINHEAYVNRKNYKIKAFNYPNPFNPSTKIFLYIPGHSRYYSPNTLFRITIYNCLGQTVRQFNDIKLIDLKEGISWNGRTGNGVDVPSGVYIYKIALTNGHNILYSFINKMIKIK